MSYVFDADDIAFGRGLAVVSQGGRRYLLKDVDGDRMQRLRQLSRRTAMTREQIGSALFDALSAHRLLIDMAAENTSRLPSRHQPWLYLPARVTQWLAWPLAPLTRPLVLLALLAAAAAVNWEREFSALREFHALDWLRTATPGGAMIVIGTFLASSIVHELSHIAACMRLTGLAGGVRVRSYRGLPALAADVSPLCLTDARGRAVIATSGAVVQAAFASALLYASDPDVRIGAVVALLSAMFSLLPLPNTDGYWLIRDLFGVPLRPMLARSRGKGILWSDVLYGHFLVMVTVGLFLVLLAESWRLAMSAFDFSGAAPVRAITLCALAAYIVVIAMLLARSHLQLFFGRTQ